MEYPGACTRPQFLQTPQGLALQLPLDAFLTNVLPPLRPGLHATTVVSALTTNVSNFVFYGPISSRGRWRAFAEDPEDMEGPARQVFRALEDVIRSICKASGLGGTPNHFQCNPKSIPTNICHDDDSLQYPFPYPPCPTNILRDDNSLPDSFLHSGQRSCCLWSDILAFGELRKTSVSTDVYDNTEKVLNSIYHCMHRDPRHRFVFAFTIENVDMRLWYCDRSQKVVSESFNFMTDHRPFVHFVLSIMYAGQSELGLDPSMTLINEGRQLDITVYSENGGMRLYRTLGLLAERGPDALHGKGTRVWKAVQIVDGRETGDHIALKDAWVDAERPLEGITFSQVLAACHSTDPSQHIDDSLVAVQDHGYVVTNGALDCTRIISGRVDRHNTPSKTREDLLELIRRSKTSYPVASIPSLRLQNVSCLVHYRIVYKEVCKPLSEERSLTTIFRALAQIALILKSLHAAGWVHRDISDGNILLQDGMARLTDLEYAKKYGRGSDYRLGVQAFMPVEVDWQTYQFDSRTARRLVTDPMKLEPRSPVGSDDFDRLPAQPVVVEKPFRYNAVHDLESLWWIALYFIFKLDIVRGPPQVVRPSSSSKEQRALAHQLFEYDQAKYVRSRVFTGGKHSFLEVRHAFPRFWAPIGTQMDHLRHELFARYCDIEEDCTTIDKHCADGLHELFHATFVTFVDRIQNRNFIVRPFMKEDPPANEASPLGEDAHTTPQEDVDRKTSKSDDALAQPRPSAKRSWNSTLESEPTAKRAKLDPDHGRTRYLPSVVTTTMARIYNRLGGSTFTRQ